MSVIRSFLPGTYNTKLRDESGESFHLLAEGIVSSASFVWWKDEWRFELSKLDGERLSPT